MPNFLSVYLKRWRFLKAQQKPRKHELGIVAHVEAVFELAKVLPQMLARDVDMRAGDAALQDRPHTLKAIRMMRAAHPFLFGVVHATMHKAELREDAVSAPFIRADRATRLDVLH